MTHIFTAGLTNWITKTVGHSDGSKDAWETDPSHKIRAEALRANTEVIKAVKKAFPEH
jgi:hypothetical protein